MSLHPGYSFDAAALLGIGTPSTEPLPVAAPGEIILRIPDGMSLQFLRDSPTGKNLLHQEEWYNLAAWRKDSLPAGIYRLRIPVPDSNRKTASEQDSLLAAVGETSAPVVLVAAALLCIHLQGGPDPLHDGWCRCCEQSPHADRATLVWYDGQLKVVFSTESRGSGFLWASSVQHISS